MQLIESLKYAIKDVKTIFHGASERERMQEMQMENHGGMMHIPKSKTWSLNLNGVNFENVWAQMHASSLFTLDWIN